MSFISNALKFTHQGEVRVSASLERVESELHWLSFNVRDSGIGIPAERIDSLFHPFTQVDASSTRRFGGTGLGLTISRRMANIMNGDIAVESTLGEGSTFTFTVEADVVEWMREEAAEAIVAVVEGGQSLKVLVVEDHPVNRMILEAWMGSAGHASATAENGQIVVALVDDTEVTLKRLRRRGNSIALEPCNVRHETRIFPADRVKVQGRIVALTRKY